MTKINTAHKNVDKDYESYDTKMFLRHDNKGYEFYI